MGDKKAERGEEKGGEEGRGRGREGEREKGEEWRMGRHREGGEGRRGPRFSQNSNYLIVSVVLLISIGIIGSIAGLIDWW